MSKILLFFLLITSLLACSSDTTTSTQQTVKQTDWRTAWIENLKTGTAVGEAYLPNGAVFIDGKFTQGAENINTALQKWSKLRTPVGAYTQINTIEHDSIRLYELGYYQAENSKRNEYAYLIAWHKQNGEWLRELDIIYPIVFQQQTDQKPIDQARVKWMRLSNAHDHAKLVSELYTDDAIYFNSTKLYQGIPAITEKYSYMSRPNWKIQLRPINIAPIQANIVYEVGQYVSSGVGHYVIIWEKQSDDTWKIALDFNF